MSGGLTRAFVAVPVGLPLAAELSRRLDALPGPAPVRWTAAGTWHLTLQFLGDWPADRLEALQTALSGLAAPGAFALEPAGLGGFPDLFRPRVLFLQFRDAGPLVDLARKVREASATAWPDGPQDTRPLHPHLTLARLRDPLTPQQLNLLRDIDLHGLPPFEAGHFELLSSRLGPGGARHAVLAAWPLRKKGE